MNIENEEPWTEVPNEDAKTLIDSPSWRGLIHAIAEWHVEESALDSPWRVDSSGIPAYTEDAQNKYDHASDVAKEIIGQYLIKDNDDL